MNIIKEIKRLLKVKPKRPACSTDNLFLYCYCGKCEPKGYELPDDFKRMLTIKCVDIYNGTPIKKDL